MALQSSLTEVDWSYCRFDGKSNIGLTVLVYCVACARVSGERLREGRERLVVFACVCLGVHRCMFVCACI